ncbi:MAG: response regulator transcription factor [Lysobacterales bacterium]
MSDSARLALIEDDPGIRSHFAEIVASMADVRLVGSAGSVAEVAALLLLQPDLWLVDIGLPDGSGLDLIPRLKTANVARVLVITSFGDRQTVVRAIAAGADGYLLKDSSSEAITEGIRVTLDGGAPISAAAAVYLLERLREAPPPTPAPLNPDEAALTAREIELLHCFAIGQSYKEAARTLGISPHTVGNHVKSVYRKLEVHSRAEAIYEAVQGGQLRL